MKHLYSITPIALLTLLFCACSPKFYSPNMQNIPLMEEKGQAQIMGGGNGSHIDLQGAYAFTDHVAAQLNTALFVPPNLNNGNGGSGMFIEAGPGYYRTMNDLWVFETYGLFGYGSFENHLPSTVSDYPNTTGDISGQLIRYGIQPAIGFSTRYFSAAISSRVAMLSYFDVSGNLTYDNTDQVKYLRNHSDNLLFEPAITIRGGLDFVKLQMQLGRSFNLVNPGFRQDDTFLTFGLMLNLRTGPVKK